MKETYKGEITPENALSVLKNYEELQYSGYNEFCVNDKYTQIPIEHEIKRNILGILTKSRGGGSSLLLIDLDTEMDILVDYLQNIQDDLVID